MIRSKAGHDEPDDQPANTADKSPTHDVDCVTGGAGSDEFSPTASPGSPLDSDEALDDLPPELLCDPSIQLDKSCTSTVHDKDEPSAVGDRSRAKDLSKVRQFETDYGHFTYETLSPLD